MFMFGYPEAEVVAFHAVGGIDGFRLLLQHLLRELLAALFKSPFDIFACSKQRNSHQYAVVPGAHDNATRSMVARNHYSTPNGVFQYAFRECCHSGYDMGALYAVNGIGTCDDYLFYSVLNGTESILYLWYHASSYCAVGKQSLIAFACD